VGAAVAGVALAAVLVPGCSDDPPAPTTFVVGDSLTVGAQIGGLGDGDGLEVEALTGRTTTEGVDVAEAADLDGYDQIIVALGTNDYLDSEADFAPKIDAMMAVLGSEVPVTWVNVDAGTPKLARTADGVNAALAAAAARHPNLTIADWDAYINGRDDADDLRAGDEVHDSTEGYRVRAEWMRSLAG
jgi:hypothetical protein